MMAASGAAIKRARLSLPKLIFGADHGGYGMKMELIRYVKDKGYDNILDVGTTGENGKGNRVRSLS